MGGVEAKPDANQRGQAAQIRQMDDNRGKTMLNSGERQFVNSVIHSPNENYSPKFDKGLQDLSQRFNPNDPYQPRGAL